MGVVRVIVILFRAVLLPHAALAAENLALRHGRRRVVYFNAAPHPTARWTARQVVEAFPVGAAPRFLIRDHHGIDGQDFRKHNLRGNVGVLQRLDSEYPQAVGGRPHRDPRAGLGSRRASVSVVRGRPPATT